MKKGKGIVIFLWGCGFGAALSFFITKKVLGDRIRAEEEDIRDKELEEIREYYRQGSKVKVSFDVEEMQGDVSVQKKTNEDLEPVKTMRKMTGYDNFYRKKGVDIVGTNNYLGDPGGPEDDEPEEDEEDNYDEACENCDSDQRNSRSREAFHRGIEIISGLEYNELECPYGVYDKRELLYYTDDEILCDNEDQILDGYLDLVGADFIDVLEQGDQKVVYVRNNKIATDFRIEKINSARFDVNGF